MKSKAIGFVVLLSLTSTLTVLPRSTAGEDAATVFYKANLFYKYGYYRRALQYYARAVKLEPRNPEYRNGAAWLLATARDPMVRDGEKAVDQAGEAVFGADRQMKGYYSDTLAAAFARKGLFAPATEMQARALAAFRANKKWQDEIPNAELRFKAYQEGKPWEEGAVPLEPLIIPARLYRGSGKQQIDQLVMMEDTPPVGVYASIYLWRTTGIAPAGRRPRIPDDVIAPLEYVLVSDDKYENETGGRTFVVMMAIGNHQRLVELMNKAKHLSYTVKCGLIAEMAVGVCRERAKEIESICLSDISPDSQERNWDVWKPLDAAIAMPPEMKK